MGKTRRLDNRKVLKHALVIGDTVLDTTIFNETDNTNDIGCSQKQLRTVYSRNINTDILSSGNLITNNITSGTVIASLVTSENIRATKELLARWYPR
jgi:hypothetical protein